MQKEVRYAIYVLVVGFIATVAIGALLSCKSSPAPRPDGDPGTVSKVIDCTVSTVRESWPNAYPSVMHCLTVVMVSPMNCLDAVATTVQVGIDVVACIVSSAGKEAAFQSTRNADDAVSVRQAERARAWLASKKFQFQE